MPNTLAHIGVQTLVTRGLMRDADVKWILLGAVIPDLPWIAARVCRAVWTVLPPIDLRLYAIAQSSLLMSVVLSAALAVFSRDRLRVFTILAAGSLMHLLLDAAQTKWGNGVLLAAPVDWTLLNFGLFWPEDPPTLVLTALGVPVAAWAFLRANPNARDLRRPGRVGLLVAVGLFATWICAPFAAMDAAERADLHSTGTLRLPPTERVGRIAAFDRARILAAGDEALIWTAETLDLTGAVPTRDGAASLRGHFTNGGAFFVTGYHPHPDGLRDGASYVGLAIVLGVWGSALSSAVRQRPTDRS